MVGLQLQKRGAFWRKACEAAAVLGLAACLSGCEIAGVTLPDIPLPDLSSLNLPKLSIPFLEGETDEAEALDALANHTQTVTSPTIRETGVLTVGVNTHTTLAPMMLPISDGADLNGMDVDIAAALANEMGLRVRFIAVDDTDAACDSTVDVVFSTTNTMVESSTVVGSYAESAMGFFRKGTPGMAAAAELQGARIGVQIRSASEAALNDTALNAAVQEYESLNDAFTALEAGEIDYVLCDAYAGAYLAAAYSDISFAGTLDSPSLIGIAVASSNTALQQAVQQGMDAITSNGILDLMRARWVGELPVLTSDQQISGIPMAAEHEDSATPADGESEETTVDGED